MLIDLRSDTVTRPTPAMRQAMANAEVGDDVIDVDPTVAKLEQYVAELLGKEAAIYMPSGTMTNQIAIRVHCGMGGEFICDEDCHVYNYEQGAFAQLSGVIPRTIKGDFGVLDVSQLLDKVRPLNDHMVQTKLLCLENTHNRGGGRVWPFEKLSAACRWAKTAGLVRHLDGARLFNAVAATQIAASDWAAEFDTVSVCFSKGLGAPVGSALLGPKDFIKQARRARKLFGGGMRQSGIIAAGALYALQNHRERLVEDHLHAKMLADTLRNCRHIKILPDQIDSNIVIAELAPPLPEASEFVARMRDEGVWMMSVSSRAIRMVTHLDVNREQIEKACKLLRQAIGC
jgi:threonine aldolase